MAIITPGLITALHTTYKADFDAAYAAAMAASFWMDVATEVSSSSSQNTYGWLGDFPDMREWVGDRVLKDMEAQAYAIENKSYESSVSVPRPVIEDENTGVYRPMMRHMGDAAARHPDQLIAGLLKAGDATACYDGQNFFDADHPVNAAHDGSGADASVSNVVAGAVGDEPKWFLLSTDRPLKPLIHQMRKPAEFVSKTDPRSSDTVFMSNKFVWGVDSRCNVGFGLWQQAVQSQAPLDGAGLDQAIRMMQEFKADGGRALGIMPTLLVVPPALRAAAISTVKVMFGEGGASNRNYEAVQVKIVPWLA